MKDLISIVIPVYNVEPYLRQCLDSVTGQSYDNIEIILVDDGSTDKSGLICEEYASYDRRIRVVHKENGGLSDARNLGLELCSGKYVTFIDSDDFVARNYVEELYRILTESGAEISVCDYKEFYTEQEPDQCSDEDTKIVFDRMQALEQIYGKYCVQMTTAWGKLYKVELFDTIRFPVGRVHEDVFVAHRLLYKASKVAFTTQKLYFYRKRRDSITGGGFKPKNRLDALLAITERANFFEQEGLSNLSEKTYKWLLSYGVETYVLAKKESEENEELFKGKLLEISMLVQRKSASRFVRLAARMAYSFPRFTYSLLKIRSSLKSLFTNPRFKKRRYS